MEINDIINGLSGGNSHCGNEGGINAIPGLCGGLGNGLFGGGSILWILLIFFFGFGRNGCSNGMFGNMNNNNCCCCNNSCCCNDSCCCKNSKCKSVKTNKDCCCCNNQGMGGSWWLFLLVILFLCTNNQCHNNVGCPNSIVEV